MDEKETKVLNELNNLKTEVSAPRHVLETILREAKITTPKEPRYQEAKVFTSGDWRAAIFRTALAFAALVIFIGGATELGLRSDKFLGESVFALEAEASSINYDLDEESFSSSSDSLDFEFEEIDQSLDVNN